MVYDDPSQGKPVLSDDALNKIITGKSKHAKPFFLILAIAVLAAVSFVVYISANLGSIKAKNLGGGSPLLTLPKFNPNSLKGEGDGRINVLLIGMGGAGHPGGQLADTIMVASIDPKNKEAAFLSIPRDLYIAKYPKPLAGGGKINAIHALGEQNKVAGGGSSVMKTALNQLLDLPIHYFIRVDFDGFRKVVDSLGGVSVNVEKQFYDPSYPAANMIDYEPFSIQAGLQKLDGKTALKYARSRHGSNGEGSDFSRAKRQQQVLLAIKEKALNVNVLANPAKIAELTNILSNHIKTDITIKELERLYQITKDINKDKIVTKVLDNAPGGPLTADSNEMGYFLILVDPTGRQVKQIAHDIFKDPYISSEQATIEIRSQAAANSLAEKLAKELTGLGYSVVKVAKTDAHLKISQIIDQTSGKKPVTLNYLTRRLNATKATTTTDSKADIVILLGEDYDLKTSSAKN